MNNPVLSIITINRNNKVGLKKTLESIKLQSFDSYEHIIIDGNSTDGSKEIIKTHEACTSHLSYWVSEPDKGIYDAMNKGIRKANGEYLYFLNSGDCLAGDILKEISFDGTCYIWGDMNLIRPEAPIDRTAPDNPDLLFFYFDSLSHQACFIHRSLFENQLYSTQYKIISDWAHSVENIIFKGCSYKHVHLLIADCDGSGVSSDYSTVQCEREKWFKDHLSAPLHSSLLEYIQLSRSPLRTIIPKINQTRKFKKRIKRLVVLLYQINRFFSKKPSSASVS